MPASAATASQGRGGRGIGWGREVDLDQRFGDDLERRVGGLHEQPGDSIAEVVQSFGAALRAGAGGNGRGEDLLRRKRARHEMKHVAGEIDCLGIGVGGDMTQPIPHYAAPLRRAGASSSSNASRMPSG